MFKKSDETKDEEMTVEDEEDEEEGEGQAKPPKMLLKVTFNEALQALGLRHLSPYGGREVEVLVSPLQKFYVKKINAKEDKGFSVVVLQSVQ